MRVVLAIAASDPSGAAGLQADLKAIAANGGYGASVLTAVTAQNRAGVTRVEPVQTATVAAQLEAVLGHGGLPVAAVKSGVLGTPAAMLAVAAALGEHPVPHYVLDPVMTSTSGHRFISAAAEKTLLRHLLPLATLATPNAVEAAALLGWPALRDRDDALRAGQAWLATGCHAVLVKGGHLSDDLGTDVLVQATTALALPAAPAGRGEAPFCTTHSRGTGCSLASAIATHLARGRALDDAVRLARRYLGEAVRQGSGAAGAPDHLFMLRRPAGWRRTLRLEASQDE